MSKKLFDTLTMCKETGNHSRTFGALDVVQATTMAPKLSSIYVSGWQSSSTASTSNEPGPDFADYPMDTVPNKVHPTIPIPISACTYRPCSAIDHSTHPHLPSNPFQVDQLFRGLKHHDRRVWEEVSQRKWTKLWRGYTRRS